MILIHVIIILCERKLNEKKTNSNVLPGLIEWSGNIIKTRLVFMRTLAFALERQNCLFKYKKKPFKLMEPILKFKNL